MARRRISPFYVILAVIIMFVAFLFYTIATEDHPPVNDSTAQPTASPTAPSTTRATLQTCGPVDLDKITLVYKAKPHILKDKAGKSEPRTVATFYPWGCPTQTEACTYMGPNRENPDPECSPGAIYDLTGNKDPAKYNAQANQDLICDTKTNDEATGGRRKTSDKDVSAVWRIYGQKKGRVGTYETDHIVQLSLGGSNVAANLFPQLDNGEHGFDEKDDVERELAEMVCELTPAGAYRYSLTSLQNQLVQDWRPLYETMIKQGRIKT